MSEPGSTPLVTHVVYRLAVGGLENGVVNLIDHLPAERFRHSVVCLTEATDFARRIRRADVPIVELNKQPGNSLAIHRQFYDVFRRMRPAIVHTRNLAALEAQFGATLARVPVRIHSEHGWDTADSDGSSRRHAMIRRFYSPFVHRYVALSRHIERYLAERVGIPHGRIERICNGVDCERFRPEGSDRRAFPHPPFRSSEIVLVGTVGRLEPVKDQVTLARAFVAALAQAPSMRERLRLVIVGAGSLEGEIERVLAEAGVRELAWLAGERSDVPALLGQLDVFVLPSRAEGISNTILEAMACGVPVIATAVGGNVELVDGGETGELVPRADAEALGQAIVRLASDEALRRRLGAAARERAVSRFSLAEMVRQYGDLYEHELARRAPGLLTAPAAPCGAALVD